MSIVDKINNLVRESRLETYKRKIERADTKKLINALNIHSQEKHKTDLHDEIGELMKNEILKRCENNAR